MSYANIAVIDVGARNNIGWAIAGTTAAEGTDIDDFVTALGVALASGPLALGFEAPMFVPVHRNANHLTRARRGEGNRPYSVAAGAAALVCGLATVPYILSRLRAVHPAAEATFDWKAPPKERSLLLFEAFVTGRADRTNPHRHVEDALLAIGKMRRGLGDPESFASDIDEEDRLNLLGAALLRTGWTDDLSVLGAQCLVVRQSRAA